MENFFNKEEYSISDIEALIAMGAEESINLEFKSKGALQNTNKHKNELAKDVSAFANSAGGIIIYGIEEVEHVASSISFINDEKITKEWIEQILNSNIFRKLDGLRIIPVKTSANDSQRVFLIKVNESKIGPHMVNNKYYKRHNFQAIPMEEYEVRSNYFKSQQPVLEIGDPILHESSRGYVGEFSRNTGHFKVIFTVKNSGNVLEKDYKLEVFIPDPLYLRTYRTEVPFERYEVKRYTGTLDRHFMVPGRQTLFPRELIEIGEVFIYVKDKQFAKREIYMNLFYTGGIVSRKISIEDLVVLHNSVVASQTLGY